MGLGVSWQLPGPVQDAESYTGSISDSDSEGSLSRREGLQLACSRWLVRAVCSTATCHCMAANTDTDLLPLTAHCTPTRTAHYRYILITRAGHTTTRLTAPHSHHTLCRTTTHTVTHSWKVPPLLIDAHHMRRHHLQPNAARFGHSCCSRSCTSSRPHNTSDVILVSSLCLIPIYRHLTLHSPATTAIQRHYVRH